MRAETPSESNESSSARQLLPSDPMSTRPHCWCHVVGSQRQQQAATPCKALLSCWRTVKRPECWMPACFPQVILSGLLAILRPLVNSPPVFAYRVELYFEPKVRTKGRSPKIHPISLILLLGPITGERLTADVLGRRILKPTHVKCWFVRSHCLTLPCLIAEKRRTPRRKE